MKLAALTSSLPMELPAAIAAIAELGFRWIDVPPTADPAARRALRDRELQVACVALERDPPYEVDVAAQDDAPRRRSVAYFLDAIARTAELNAPAAYVTPPVASDASTLGRWSESLVTLADCAETHDVRLCVEHFPRRALPTVAATLRFLDEVNHNALALLIDVGHCLISNEDAAAAVIACGKRLGYLHFDDNDGVDDLHWALLDGRLSEPQIAAVIEAQRSAEYEGALCVELNPTLEQPLENLRRSRAILLRGAQGR
jgi:sugar phosphate isomerase/epimerase